MDRKKLYQWCSINVDNLVDHQDLKTPFRLVEDSTQMGQLMARELVSEIKDANKDNRTFRAIIPCGPVCWYEPFVRMVNEEKVSLKKFEVFHMDECLDWQGQLLSENDPYNFRSIMLKLFYGGIDDDLAVLPQNRNFLSPDTMEQIRQKIWEAPIDMTIGGWGQDGHVAYNQARRHPFNKISLDDLRESTIRIQENNIDTIITLGQRTYGAAYQFVPPMSITLGIKECLSAKKVRVYSDTGTWKQTALRVALFSDPDAEYPLTLLQEHPDAKITATRNTARHPISEHPEWGIKGVNE